jgi:hypothetical protein
LDFGNKVVTVRSNNLHLEFLRGYMEAVMSGLLTAFMGL